MTRPTILSVDDDPQVSAALTRDLKRRYGSEYRVLSATSAAQALELLRSLALRTDPVALIVSDQRMPEMTGIELLGESEQLAPEAKRLLLTAYADTDVAIAAINDIGLDYYLLKPWDPPEDRLFPVTDDLLGDWRRAHPEVTNDVQVVGDRWSDRTHQLKTFLARNHVPYRWYDVERDDEGGRLFTLAGGLRTDLPLVLVPDREPLRAPTMREAAGALGLHVEAERPLYDVCIVGGGPAGLAAGVYAASEGLSTVIVEREAPGGQAGQSSSIENYLGFPKGLSGSDLAQRALAQVSRFGAELVLAREVVGLEERGTVRAVLFEGGGEVEARSVVVSTGVSYRRLEALAWSGCRARASTTARPPRRPARPPATWSMSWVVPTPRARRRSTSPATPSRSPSSCADPTCWPRCRRTSSTGSPPPPTSRSAVAPRWWPRTATPTSSASRSPSARPASARRSRPPGSSSFIGASPRTDWLGGSVARDAHGFLLTGPEVVSSDAPWSLARAPFALETSLPGVFAAGDVRLESMKRVASAVGEGAMSIYLVHRYLATV